MTSFDDLHTGNSGIDSTFGNEEPPIEQEEAISEQQAELQALLPSVEYIQTVLDEEIKAVSDIRAYINSLGPQPTPTQLHDEYRARELYISLITRLKDSISDKVLAAEQVAKNG